VCDGVLNGQECSNGDAGYGRLLEVRE